MSSIEKDDSSKNRRVNSARLKQVLLERYNDSCASCGISGNADLLDIASITSFSIEDETADNSYTLLCPNCHKILDATPKEYDFMIFLTELLKSHKAYKDVQIDVLIGKERRYRADILGYELSNNKPLLIECKTFLRGGSKHSKAIIGQLKSYQEAYGKCKLIFAVPATLKATELDLFYAEGIVVWDMQHILREFKQQILECAPSHYKTLFLVQSMRSPELSREQQLIGKLSQCSPGRADCYLYQSLVGDILEHIFSPPLNKPIPELSDQTKTNRRDFIMPNYSESGFWAFMRDKYSADYVIIDAKNYSSKVKKKEVLQMANYLKLHGAGLFGIIISRKGGDSSGCENTLREQWLISKKMIIVLDDNDIIEMLLAKFDGRSAEDIIGKKIEQFRLSM